MAALLGAAVTATDESRFCDALYLFEALNMRSPSPRALYNAAEVAFAAGDRVKALDLYRLTQRIYPSFEKKDLIQTRADSVFKAMVKAGPGTACPVRSDVCGDWMLRPIADGEACDDGNDVDGDGCDRNCTFTTCGNGIVTAGEACDDANRVDGDGCDSNCSVSACGNGITAGKEQCDDGNAFDGDGCDHNCTATSCGNGIVSVGEACDDGNVDDNDGCDRYCEVPRCGNAMVTGLEQCDDGNEIPGDGCENNCTRTRVKRPLPGVILSVLSAAGGAAGAGLIYLGTTPYTAHENAVTAIAAAEESFASARTDDERQAALAAATTAQNQAASSLNDTLSWSTPAIVGGSVIAGAGLVGLAAGIYLAFTDSEVEGGYK